MIIDRAPAAILAAAAPLGAVGPGGTTRSTWSALTSQTRNAAASVEAERCWAPPFPRFPPPPPPPPPPGENLPPYALSTATISSWGETWPLKALSFQARRRKSPKRQTSALEAACA